MIFLYFTVDFHACASVPQCQIDLDLLRRISADVRFDKGQIGCIDVTAGIHVASEICRVD